MNQDTSNGFVQYKIEDKIATITFFSAASNSFPSHLLQELTNTFDILSENDSVSVIILQSEGKTFCSGASFDELLSIDNFEDGKTFFSGFANVINAMRTCKKLIIGRVQGKAVGGGVGLAAACDYVFATENAAIKLSELAIGIGPFVIEPAVSRKIGITAMSQLTLDATNWKPAYWALDKGLYSEIFESLEDLDKSLIIFAKNLANYNNEALLAMKQVFWENTNHWESLLYERAAISGQLVLSDFTKNALSDFRK